MKSRTKVLSRVAVTAIAIGVVEAIMEVMPFGDRKNKHKEEVKS